MKMRRLLSCIMTLLLVCSLPVSVFAEEYDLAKGSITVTADELGQYVTQADNGIKDHKEESKTVITQTDSKTSTTNNVTITAKENATANVTLDGVNIDTSSTTISLITTEKNNLKKFDMTLTDNGTQEEQKETPKGLLTYKIDCTPRNNDSLNDVLQFTSTSDNASLTLSVGSLQTLKEQSIDSIAFTVRDVTYGFKNSDVLKKIDSKFDSSSDSTSAYLKSQVVLRAQISIDEGVDFSSLVVVNEDGNVDISGLLDSL